MNIIMKVKNDGRHLRDQKTVVTFLTNKGNRTPKDIWVGYSDGNIELCDITLKGLKSKLERDNRLSKMGKFNNVVNM